MKRSGGDRGDRGDRGDHGDKGDRGDRDRGRERDDYPSEDEAHAAKRRRRDRSRSRDDADMGMPPEHEGAGREPRQDSGRRARDRDRRPSVGVICFWDRTKGYGFIKCPEQTAQDIYFPRGALPPDMQDMRTEELKGAEVSFEFFMAGEKPRADNIHREGRGGGGTGGGGAGGGGGNAGRRLLPPPPPKLAADNEPGRDRGRERERERDRDPPRAASTIGLIVRYEEGKGFGFINSDDGQEMFFLKSELPPELATRRREEIVDTRVSCEVVNMPDGKLRARRLKKIESSTRGARGGDGGGSRGAGARDRGGGGDSRRDAHRGAVTEGRVGRIVRYDRAKGYGFIRINGEPEDVFFLHSAVSKDLSSREDMVDTEVEVDFMANEDGKPRAVRVVTVSGGRGGRSSSRQQSSSRRGATPRDGDIEEGVICSFDLQKGFGFIAPDNFPEDVFYLRGELPAELKDVQNRDQVIGQRVEFEVRLMPDGKTRAQKILIVRPAAPKAPAAPSGPAPGRVLIGKVKRFDKSKGYGFIGVDGHDDLFFLHSAIPKDIPEEQIQNMEVAFEHFITEEGKPRATRLWRPSAADFHGMPQFMPDMMGRHMGHAMMGKMAAMMPPAPPHPVNMPPPVPVPARDRHQERHQDMGGDRVYRGKVVSFEVAKGFGFIKSDELSEDVWFSKSELPAKLKDTQDKNEVKDQIVEFEIKEMPDGKLRGRRITITASSNRGGPRPAPPRRVTGRILEYRAAKGYGFIRSEAAPENVFFLRSMLPKEYRDDNEKLKDEVLKELPVSFELCTNEEGKPRANNVEVLEDGEQPAAAVVKIGTIVRYDMTKGYGFISPEGMKEDVFFLRAELPPQLLDAQEREEIEKHRVEFEVVTMPDGKLRGVKLELVPDSGPGPESDEAVDPAEPEDAAEADPLDEDLLAEMADFLAQSGGSCDFRDFSDRFPKALEVPHRNLEPHFDFREHDGQMSIILRGSRQDEADDEAAPPPLDDDPAIPLGPGCQPTGRIRRYDPSRGFGFIACQELEQDVFFPRLALPKNFRTKKPDELPSLLGVEVAFDVLPGERGLRAENISLLLKWHAGDKCWLLKRSSQ